MLIDCFMFSGEAAALQIRMNELNDIVDKFVIVEGTKTFRGEEKTLYLDLIWDLMEPWHDRIHRVIVEHWPETDDPWVMEKYQRDQISRGLQEIEAAQDDIVIVSDADEVPRASVVKALNLWSGSVHLEMNTYYFYLDWKVPDRWNQGGRPFVAIREQMGSPQEMRDTPKRMAVNGAWHFSYMGGMLAVNNKIKSFAHAEYDTPEFTDIHHIKHCAEQGLDPFERFKLEPVEIDDTYPQWVQDNKHELRHLLRGPDNDSEIRNEERGVLG